MVLFPLQWRRKCEAGCPFVGDTNKEASTCATKDAAEVTGLLVNADRFGQREVFVDSPLTIDHRY